MDAFSKVTDMIWNRDEGDKSESPADRPGLLFSACR
jgi:hypothetical protein